MPSWTDDQKKAITSRGGKIIVSAAAGSGKTAVLSQRVITYVTDGGNIDDLLIVTFTNAAAQEMKERIKKEIVNATVKNPDNNHLKNQLQLVETAQITTMDAFYNNLVKENFDKLKIDRNFSILSQEEEKIIKNKVLKEVLENAFTNLEGFSDVLKMFKTEGELLIKEPVLKISSYLDTIAFPNEFIKDSISKYSSDNHFYRDLMLNQVKQKMESFTQIYDEIIDLFKEDKTFERVLVVIENERKFINNFLLVKDLDELSSLIRSISFDRLSTPKGFKDDPIIIRYKTIRDDLKKVIQKDYFELGFITEDRFKKEQETTRKTLVTLFDFINTFKEKLLEEKKKINAYSFSDIAHFVIELLIKDNHKTKLAKELSLRYKEILIDEYQDTNNLQNVIFNAISNDDSNLFVVGDVKQSIYRFRSACPEIFNEDKQKASKESFPLLITLSKNFRSRKEVLDFCNFIFSNTMTSYFGEVSYDKDEMLYLGANFEQGDNLDPEVLLIDGKVKDEDEDDELTNAQKEAIVVADKIKDMLSNGYKVFDNKKGLWRKLKPSDIVILLRSLSNSDLYIKALNKRNISAYSEVSHEYFDNYEIKLVISLLKTVDNPYDDISLMSVLNSDLIDVSLDDVVSLRALNKNVSLYENMMESSNECVNKVLNLLSELKSYANNNSVYKLLNKVYKDFDLLAVIGGLKQDSNRVKNLIHMLNYANLFECKSLHEFITYIENIILNKGTLEGVNPLSNEDNVLITTIHKSKGLEYPVVFLSETGRGFNLKDLKNDLMINTDLNVAFNLRNDDYKVKYVSLPMMTFKNYELKKALSEELRILYVALTRAKEKIIITGFSRNLEGLINKAASKMGNYDVVSNLYLDASRSYLDIMMPCFLRHPMCKNLRDYSLMDVKTKDARFNLSVNVINANEINESEFLVKERILSREFDHDWLNKVLNFKYDDKFTKVPSLVSVSEIKKKKQFLRKPNFLNDGVNHTDIGTLYHKVLENLPIKKYHITDLNDELNNMVEKNVVSKEDLKKLNMDKLFAYLTSDIYDMILNSTDVRREYKITFKAPINYYDDSLSGMDVLVDGVIDLLCKTNDTYVIVDYKTDNVDLIEELKDRYKVQLDLYEIAVKDVLKAKKVRKFIYSIKLNKFIEV